MQVSVESTGGLERKMTVQLPAEHVEQAVESRLRSMAPRVRMDGFRPGKVPFKLLRQRYGPQVRQEVLGELLQSSFQEAVAQQRLRLAGAPRIEPVSLGGERDLEYTATFEVYPEIEVTGLDTIRIERPAVQIGEADVDRMIENLRAQRREWVEVERPAADGDRVTVDFLGRIDGEPFEGGRGEQVPVELGAGAMLADFEAGLRGRAPGEAARIEVRFPDDYHGQAVAGKTAEFEVTVHKVAEPRLPEVDADLARAFGVPDGSVEGLRREVRENMQRELDQAVKSQVKRQVMDGLVGIGELELPRALVDQEVETLQQQAAQNLGRSVEDLGAIPREPFEEQARRRVKLGLLVGELVRSQGIEVDRDRVRHEVEAIAAGYEDPREVVRHYYAHPEALRSVEGLVLEDQVVDLVLEKAQLIDVPRSFDEVMNPQAKSGA